MDNPFKLKIKVGEHEFESEGPIDVVQAQFAAFRDLISTIPPKRENLPAAEEQRSAEQAPLPHLQLTKILKVDGRVISLTARCDTVDEAVLVILLGQLEIRDNQEVTGAEIMDGLKQSGFTIGRVDKTMDKLARDGSVITMGVNRGRRYRLTNLGKNNALGIAKEVILTVP
ncbi:MAG: hypothetical protein WA609_04880 [Terriglobales bacterium]